MSEFELFKNLNLSQYANYNGVQFLFITGLVSHLQEYLLYKIIDEFNFNFIYTKRNNSDLQKYLQSIQIIDKKSNYHTQAALEFSLKENSFQRVGKVTARGEWNRIGDTITFWSIGYENPIRISYFGDEIESIETYDEIYGNKIDEIESFIIGDIKILDDKVDWYEINITGYKNLNPNLIIIFSQYELDKERISTTLEENFEIIELDYNYPQLFYKRFDLLEKEIERLKNEGYQIIINSNHQDQIPENLKIFIKSQQGTLVPYSPTTNTNLKLNGINAGFSSTTDKILYLTDRELFGTIFLEKERKKLSTKKAQQILEKLEGEITIGDYVVHEDHGIGVYQGLQQEKRTIRTMDGFDYSEKEQNFDFLKIEYAEEDELLVPLQQIQKITKYIGTTEEEPNITRLHKGSWQKTIKKAKKAITLIARDLVEHYAKLQLTEIDSMEIEDSDEFIQFMESFPYEDTPDQKHATNDVIKDLHRNTPMNRLIVGDVGFGKTEVAMRAAFKTIEQGKQVAILCPTTVLAAQHHKVFKDRFKDFPVKIKYVSRFNTSYENKDIIKEAKNGDIDVLIGTHRLLSNDVEFQHLGLVIIDEEQKFGVKQKEKIRKLKYGSHTLMMSATPIPRTLSMALSQIQDVSIIATPPSNRRSIKTEVKKFDWNEVANNIMNEIKRGGQAYFVHNNIDTIESIKSRLEGLLPDVRFTLGHGRMRGNILDKTITDFYEKKYEVLICTTIIENGIDMPNVNTIIINNGQNFGLGQLYQLRGRVGRSDKQAFCYIYYKGDDLYKKEKEIESKDDIELKKYKQKRKYIDRLKAILESQELGSGFKLASKDLEIRGAGNLLGKQQHGNIHNVGLALYMQMLADEIERLRNINFT